MSQEGPTKLVLLICIGCKYYDNCGGQTYRAASFGHCKHPSRYELEKCSSCGQTKLRPGPSKDINVYRQETPEWCPLMDNVCETRSK